MKEYLFTTELETRDYECDLQMFTLFKDINLDGKTVIPFTTHEGSGLASCVSDVKREFPKATVTKGFSIYGHEVRSGRAKVEKWLKEFGY